MNPPLHFKLGTHSSLLNSILQCLRCKGRHRPPCCLHSLRGGSSAQAAGQRSTRYTSRAARQRWSPGIVSEGSLPLRKKRREGALLREGAKKRNGGVPKDSVFKKRLRERPPSPAKGAAPPPLDPRFCPSRARTQVFPLRLILA